MRRPPGAYFDCPRVPSLLVVNCGNCCLMICKSTQESVTHREKLGAQSLRLTNSIQRKGKTYALDCNDLLGVSSDPGEDTSVGTWGGGASRGVIVKFWTLRESHLAALHFALLLTMWGEYEVMQNVSVPPPKAFQWIPLCLE